MFTSLRSRLWLSYAFLIAIALIIVALVFFAFLLRNPRATRQLQQQLKVVENLILASPQDYIANPDTLQKFAQENKVRVLVYTKARVNLLDSNPGEPTLPSPRKNILGRISQTALDSNGTVWMYTSSRLPDGRFLVVAAPRPRVPVFSIFADEFLLPILEGGGIAFLLSLILAFVLSRWVADPLQKVVVAARNYPQGSEDMKPVEPNGPHEVQDLTRAFNSMVKRVHSSQQSQRDFVANVSHE